MNILVTGGTGFIGSHTAIALAEAGYQPILLDNLINSSPQVPQRLSHLIQQPIIFIEGDVRDQSLLTKIFTEYPIAAVIHFAGFKAIGEAVQQPLKYYDNNVNGTLNLLQAMQQAEVKTLIFSSSATVYGDPEIIPIAENAPRFTTNPYSRSKLIVEYILEDLCQSSAGWNIACLRYFNPVGAHPSGFIGEEPRGIPNNLMPYIAQVAIGRREYLEVFGNDYPTADGTGVRDYIHVMDIAEGHVAALAYIHQKAGWLTLNLGNGQGVSVLEMVHAFETVSHKKIPYRIVARRPGDVAQYWADSSKAFELLGWKAKRSLLQMCADSWHWQKMCEQAF